MRSRLKYVQSDISKCNHAIKTAKTNDLSLGTLLHSPIQKSYIIHSSKHTVFKTTLRRNGDMINLVTVQIIHL